ncbi:hypothetical protein DFH08DRAFT_967050 [Mycena albidolilacea]|uniref:Uncharacterized protein n=1 Tax=Mycena albidolilacea TaxID=1033008 RepID=A0AAD6ZMZ1_9AGAR|nr:hypothetical protein DFH08DRAFT_967050 [Mycena albidolilacea]
MSESPNTTPPLWSPGQVTDDLLDLAQQITPNKQSQALHKICLNLQFILRTHWLPAWDRDTEWNGNKSVSHLFRNNPLLKIYASLIRGPSGAVGLFDSQSKRPAAKTIERMHHICCALPGAITNSAILAIWLHSADTILTEIGDQMSINYCARHLQHIIEALASNKAWAVDLFTYWDCTLFPNADSPNGADGSAGRDIEEDDKDFFAFMQALMRPRSPRIHSSTSPPPCHLTPSPPSLQHTPAASSSRQEQENWELTSHGGYSRSPRRLQRHGEGQRRLMTGSHWDVIAGPLDLVRQHWSSQE